MKNLFLTWGIVSAVGANLPALFSPIPPATSSTSTLSLLKRRQGSANARRNLVAPFAPAVFSSKVGFPRGSLSLSIKVNFEEEEEEEEEEEGSATVVVFASSSSSFSEARATKEGEGDERRCCWWRSGERSVGVGVDVESAGL